MDSDIAHSSSTQNPLTLDEDEIPIPTNLRFMLDGLKILTQNSLTSDNHLIWSSQIKNLFEANGYSKYLDLNTPTPPRQILHQDGTTITNPAYPKWNLINRNLIVNVMATISPTIQPFVLQCTTVAQIWSSLKTKLQSQSRQRIIQLKAEIHNLSMKGDSMSQYLTNVKAILDQLAAAGSHIDDEDVMIYVMNGLSQAYDGFITSFRHQNRPLLPHPNPQQPPPPTPQQTPHIP